MNENKAANIEIPSDFPYVVSKGNSTVKIFRITSPKSKAGFYYQVADHTQGKRRLISKTDFFDAKREAERIAKCIGAGETHALELRGPERASYGRAVELLAPTGASLELAAATYAKAVKLLGRDRIIEAAEFFMARHPDSVQSATVAQAIEEMLEAKRALQSKPRHIEDLKSRLGRFQTAFPGTLTEIDTRAVQKWLDKLGLSNQSYNNYRTVIYSLFRFAERRGYIARGTNPVEFVERAKRTPSPVNIFTPAEFSALLHAAEPSVLPALAIGGFAGLRSAEIQRLKWSDINLQRRVITVSAENAKTATRRTVDFGDALSAWLEPIARSTGQIWHGTDDNLCDAQYRTARAASVKWKANALRHSYASYRLSVLKNAAETSLELGNSAAIVHRHYKELVRPEDAKAWFSIMPTP